MPRELIKNIVLDNTIKHLKQCNTGHILYYSLLTTTNIKITQAMAFLLEHSWEKQVLLDRCHAKI